MGISVDVGCGCDSCTCDEYVSEEYARDYDKLLKDLYQYYMRKDYAEFLERLEKEFPVDLAGISKLKLSE